MATRTETISDTAAPATQPAKVKFEARSPFKTTVGRISRHRSFQVGIILLGVLVFTALFADFIAPFDPVKPLQGVKRRTPPCIHLLGCPADQPQHIMGIDGNSRDLFSRIVYGSRLSLQIGFTTTIFAVILGVVLGALAGYAGGATDTTIMRGMDILLAFPSLILAIAIVTVLGPGLINALLAIGIVSIPIYARLFRASVLSLKEHDFVTASHSIGSDHWRILSKHILPNAITPIIVAATLGIATAILDAAALSFLGLGAEIPRPEWGLMLGEERNSVFNAPFLVFFPGLAIMITVLAFNLVGDGLRDALDPRLRIQ